MKTITVSLICLFVTTLAVAEWTDGQTAGALSAVYSSAGQIHTLASTQANNADVKSFAAKAVTDLTAANKALEDWMTSSGTKAEDSDISKLIKAQGDAIKNFLSSMHGAEFDMSYLDSVIFMNGSIMKAMETWISDTETPELKALLNDTDALLQKQVDDATMLKQSLPAPSPSPSGTPAATPTPYPTSTPNPSPASPMHF